MTMMLGKAVDTKIVWVSKRFEGWVHTKDDLEAAFGIQKIPAVGSAPAAAAPPQAPVPPAGPAAPAGPNLASLFGAVMSNPAVQSGLMNALNSTQQLPSSSSQ